MAFQQKEIPLDVNGISIVRDAGELFTIPATGGLRVESMPADAVGAVFISFDENTASRVLLKPGRSIDHPFTTFKLYHPAKFKGSITLQLYSLHEGIFDDPLITGGATGSTRTVWGASDHGQQQNPVPSAPASTLLSLRGGDPGLHGTTGRMIGLAWGSSRLYRGRFAANVSRTGFNVGIKFGIPMPAAGVGGDVGPGATALDYDAVSIVKMSMALPNPAFDPPAGAGTDEDYGPVWSVTADGAGQPNAMASGGQSQGFALLWRNRVWNFVSMQADTQGAGNFTELTPLTWPADFTDYVELAVHITKPLQGVPSQMRLYLSGALAVQRPFDTSATGLGVISTTLRGGNPCYAMMLQLCGGLADNSKQWVVDRFEYILGPDVATTY